MNTPAHWLRGLAMVFAVSCLQFDAYAEVLVPVGSTWKWYHTADGVDPAKEDEDFHTTFQTAEFDDSKWQSGKDQAGPHGGFGYGEDAFTGVDIGAPENPANRKTAYFRIKFTTNQEAEKLVLKCQRDDAIIVYLDGQEVLRNNLAADAKAAHDLFATEIVAGEAETQVNSFPCTHKLPAGEHILAISLHNRPDGSSDLRIAEISLETASED
jgi:hypothetical protein